MPSPFPGMDPYLEHPAVWRDFHDRFVTHLCEALRPILKPKYVPMTQSRLYVVEADRSIYPDVGIMRSHNPAAVTAALAVLEADAPTVFPLWHEEIREPYIEIVNPSSNNRVVTTVEVLSPTNKAAGVGRDECLLKREEFWRSGVNLVEIDLLRAGGSTVRLSAEKRKSLKPSHYLVAIARRQPRQQEIYSILLQQRLPRIAIPLGLDDPDVIIDLQGVFDRCWEAGPYPEMLGYQTPPPGTLTPRRSRLVRRAIASGGHATGRGVTITRRARQRVQTTRRLITGSWTTPFPQGDRSHRQDPPFPAEAFQLGYSIN